jgi:hypothetical protein
VVVSQRCLVRTEDRAYEMKVLTEKAGMGQINKHYLTTFIDGVLFWIT